MKINEISLFEVEKLYFTQHKDRKLDGKIYFVLELKEWMTIIDVYGDRRYFKAILTKGEGLHRIEKADVLEC